MYKLIALLKLFWNWCKGYNPKHCMIICALAMLATAIANAPGWFTIFGIYFIICLKCYLDDKLEEENKNRGHK